VVKIEIPCRLEDMRRFLIISCCKSFIPEQLLENESVFPERTSEAGAIYVEASDKTTIDRIGEISFTHAEEVIGVVYNSKSGLTKLRWERTGGKHGRLYGEASMRSLVNLVEAGAIREDDVRKQVLSKKRKTAPSPSLKSQRKLGENDMAKPPATSDRSTESTSAN